MQRACSLARLRVLCRSPVASLGPHSHTHSHMKKLVLTHRQLFSVALGARQLLLRVAAVDGSLVGGLLLGHGPLAVQYRGADGDGGQDVGTINAQPAFRVDIAGTTVMQLKKVNG